MAPQHTIRCTLIRHWSLRGCLVVWRCLQWDCCQLKVIRNLPLQFHQLTLPWCRPLTILCMLKDRYPQRFLRKGTSPPTSLALGLQDQETYSRLIRYLQGHEQLDPTPVEGMGSCMFNSIRRAIDVPLEYQNVYLRRQIVMILSNNCNFSMPLL